MKHVCKSHYCTAENHCQDRSLDPGIWSGRKFALRKYVLRRYDLPHERLKLEDDISDVEYGQKPLIIIANKV